MLLADRTDEGHHPKVFLVNRRTGIEEPIVDTWSFRPEWSPDGRWIACIAWRSPTRQRQLAIIDWRTGRIVDVDSTFAVADYRWSPDSKAIAVFGTDRVTRECVLLLANPRTGISRLIDRTSTIADVDYDWSPDGSVLAYTKPTRTSEHDEVLEADLWMADSSGKSKCCLLNTADHVEQRPIWVGRRSLAILTAPMLGESPRSPVDVVLELK
jgi:Tol biopolymer transport system component